MNRNICAAMLVLFCLVAQAHAEIKACTASIRYKMGTEQSMEEARAGALAEAKRAILEQAATYMESLSEVRDSHAAKDEILAVAAGILKVEVLSEKRFMADNGFGIEMTAKADLDTAALKRKVAALRQARADAERRRALESENRKLEERVSDLEARSGGQVGNATQDQAPDGTGRSRGDRLFREAKALWSDDGGYSDARRALALLDEALSLRRDQTTFMYRGLAYANLGQYEQAILDYDRAVQQKYDYAIAYYNRGYAYYKLKKYDKAIMDYDHAIKYKPDYALAYNNRGIIYSDVLRQYLRAIKDFDMAIEGDKNYVFAYNNRGIAFCELRKYDDAMRDFNMALQINDRYASAYCNRGLVYFNIGKFSEAIQDYDKAIQLNPDYSTAYNRRGNAYSDGLKQYDRAVQDYDQAIRLDPGYAIAYTNRGLAFQQQRKYDLAIRDYDQSIRLKPDYSAAYNNRGNAKLLSGDSEGGCADAVTACGLGLCKALNYWKAQGQCAEAGSLSVSKRIAAKYGVKSFFCPG